MFLCRRYKADDTMYSAVLFPVAYSDRFYKEVLSPEVSLRS